MELGLTQYLASRRRSSDNIQHSTVMRSQIFRQCEGFYLVINRHRHEVIFCLTL